MALEDVAPFTPDTRTDLDIINEGANDDVKDTPKTETPKETEIPKDQPKDEEDIEETEETEEKEEKPPEEDEEEFEEESEAVKLEIKQIAQEFPGVFKKYPALRDAYFRDQKYSSIFPTVQEAESAAHKSEVLDFLDNKVMNGDISVVIKAVEEENPKALKSIAKNILPLLWNTDKNLYHEAVQPALATALRVAKMAAQKNGNENLKNSVIHLTNFLFGDTQLPEPEKEPEESQELKEEREKNLRLQQQQYMNYASDVNDKVRSRLRAETLRGLDPQNEMSDWSRNKLAEDVLDELDTVLANDKRHMSVMASLWKQLSDSGYSGDLKPRIINAYLGRARNLLPQIRQRKLNEALGKKAPKVNEERKKENKPPEGGAPPSNKPKVITSKEAKEKNMTDMDIIMGGKAS